MPIVPTDPPIEYGDGWDWTTANPSRYHGAVVNQNTDSISDTDYVLDSNHEPYYPPIYFHAPDWQVQAAYQALVNHESPENFNQRVWNDMVDKIVELQDTWEVGRTFRLDREDKKYPYHSATRIQGGHSPYISSAEPGYVEAYFNDHKADNFVHRNIGHSLNAQKFNLCVNAFITLPSTWKWAWETDGVEIKPGTFARSKYILELFRAINYWSHQIPQYLPAFALSNTVNLIPYPALADALHIKIEDFDWITTFEFKQVRLDDSIQIQPPDDFARTFEVKPNPVVLDYLMIQPYVWNLNPEILNKGMKMVDSIILKSLNLNIGKDTKLAGNATMYDSIQIPVHLVVDHRFIPNPVVLDFEAFSGDLKCEELKIDTKELPLLDGYPFRTSTLVIDSTQEVLKHDYGTAQSIDSIDIRFNSEYNVKRIDTQEAKYITGANTQLKIKYSAPLAYGNFLDMLIKAGIISKVDSANLTYIPTLNCTSINALETGMVLADATKTESYPFQHNLQITTPNFDGIVRLGSSARMRTKTQMSHSESGKMTTAKIFKLSSADSIIDYTTVGELSHAKIKELVATSTDFSSSKAEFSFSNKIIPFRIKSHERIKVTSQFSKIPTIYSATIDGKISQSAIVHPLMLSKPLELFASNSIRTSETVKIGRTRYYTIKPLNINITETSRIEPSYMQTLEIYAKTTVNSRTATALSKAKSLTINATMTSITQQVNSKLHNVRYRITEAQTSISSSEILNIAGLRAKHFGGFQTMRVGDTSKMAVQQLRILSAQSNDLTVTTMTDIMVGKPFYISGANSNISDSVFTNFAYQDSIAFRAQHRFNISGSGKLTYIGSFELTGIHNTITEITEAVADIERFTAWRIPSWEYYNGKLTLVVYQTHENHMINTPSEITHETNVLSIDSMSHQVLDAIISNIHEDTIAMPAYKARMSLSSVHESSKIASSCLELNIEPFTENPDWKQPRWRTVRDTRSLAIYQCQKVFIQTTAPHLLRVDSMLMCTLSGINTNLTEVDSATILGYYKQGISTVVNHQITTAVTIEQMLSEVNWKYPYWNAIDSTATLTIFQGYGPLSRHKSAQDVLRFENLRYVDTLASAHSESISSNINVEVTNQTKSPEVNAEETIAGNITLYDGKWKYPKPHGGYQFAVLDIWQLTEVRRTSDNTIEVI